MPDDQAVRYIEESSGKSEPFFVYLAYTSPHWPLHAREEDIAPAKGRCKLGWDATREERHRRRKGMGLVDRRCPLTPRDPEVPAWADAPHKDWQQHRGIGRLLAKLEQTGQIDNTLFLFLAGNGGCAEELRATSTCGPSAPRRATGARPRGDYASCGVGWANASNTPFRQYKHWAHEGGISIPLTRTGPRASASQTGGRWRRGVRGPYSKRANASRTRRSTGNTRATAPCGRAAGSSSRATPATLPPRASRPRCRTWPPAMSAGPGSATSSPGTKLPSPGA